jgi:ADP-ribose pyrophosphatase
MTFHRAIPDRDGWITLSRNSLFQNPYVEIHSVKMQSPARKEGFEWTVCHRKAGVVVSARTTEGKWVLIKQERVPLKTEIWEFPAGQIDTEKHHSEEIIIQTGIRELEEEAGFGLSAESKPQVLGRFFSSPGFTDEHCYMLFINDVVPLASGSQPESEEAILEVRTFGAQEIKVMASHHLLQDANTLCSITKMITEGFMSW